MDVPVVSVTGELQRSLLLRDLSSIAGDLCGCRCYQLFSVVGDL